MVKNEAILKKLYRSNKKLFTYIALFIVLVSLISLYAINSWYWSLCSAKEKEKLHTVKNDTFVKLVNELDKALQLIEIFVIKVQDQSFSIHNSKFDIINISDVWQPYIIQNPGILIIKNNKMQDAKNSGITMKGVAQIIKVLPNGNKVVFRFDLNSTIEMLKDRIKNNAILYRIEMLQENFVLTNTTKFSDMSPVNLEYFYKDIGIKIWIDVEYLKQKRYEQERFAVVIVSILILVMLLTAVFCFTLLKTKMFQNYVCTIKLLNRKASALANEVLDLKREQYYYEKAHTAQDEQNKFLLSKLKNSIKSVESQLAADIVSVDLNIEKSDKESVQLVTRYLEGIKEKIQNIYNFRNCKSKEPYVSINVWFEINKAIDYWTYDIFKKSIKLDLSYKASTEIQINNITLFRKMMICIIGLTVKMLHKDNYLAIELRQDKNNLILEIKDDGFGFGFEEIEEILQGSLADEFILNPQDLKIMLSEFSIESSRICDVQKGNKLFLKIPINYITDQSVNIEANKERKNNSNVINLPIKRKT